MKHTNKNKLNKNIFILIYYQYSVGFYGLKIK